MTEKKSYCENGGECDRPLWALDADDYDEYVDARLRNILRLWMPYYQSPISMRDGYKDTDWIFEAVESIPCQGCFEHHQFEDEGDEESEESEPETVQATLG